jgi:hypothetical protein
MFDYRGFVKKALLGAVGNMPDYKIRLNAIGWLEKEFLTTTDLAEIDSAIEAQYADKEEK